MDRTFGTGLSVILLSTQGPYLRHGSICYPVIYTGTVPSARDYLLSCYLHRDRTFGTGLICHPVIYTGTVPSARVYLCTFGTGLICHPVNYTRIVPSALNLSANLCDEGIESIMACQRYATSVDGM